MDRHFIDGRQDWSDRGASLVEYVLLMSLIVLVCLSSLSAFGGGVGDSVDNSSREIIAATTP